MKLLKQYAQFSGRVARAPFWLFITVTHLLLLLLFTPALYLGMIWGVQQLGDVRYEDVLQDMRQSCIESGAIDMSREDSHLSQTEIKACIYICTPIFHAQALPIIQENAERFIDQSWQDYPWHCRCTLLALVVFALLIIPSNAMCIRRLRDAGFSPYFLLLFYTAFVPFLAKVSMIAHIVLFVQLCLPSKKELSHNSTSPSIPH